MSFSDFTTDHGRTIGRQHYLNLIEVFRINGKTSPAEYELLKKEGVNRIAWRISLTSFITLQKWYWPMKMSVIMK